MLEERELLLKGQILKGKLSLSAQQRSERSCNDPQPLDHRPETNRARQKKAIESTRTNIQEEQALFDEIDRKNLAAHLARSPLSHSHNYGSAGDRTTCFASLPQNSGPW